jgi:hypothetical protein
MKEQIAKDLQDSGLFDWADCLYVTYDQKNPPREEVYFVDSDMTNEAYEACLGRWPDADTTEAILGEVELQVVYIGNDFFIVDDRDYQTEIEETNFFGWPYGYVLQNIKRGQRTLANNAALARLSKQPEWIGKLKTAIETVKGKERR